MIYGRRVSSSWYSERWKCLWQALSTQRRGVTLLGQSINKKCVENTVTSLLFPETSEVSHSYYIRTLYIQDLRFRLSPVNLEM